MAKKGKRPNRGLASQYPAEYHAWWVMVGKCHRPGSQNYEYFGAKGVQVCAQWRVSFPCFLADVGPKPGKGMWLCRVDNSKNFMPGNVHWTTSQEGIRQRRDYTQWLTWQGQTLCLKDWAKKVGVAQSTLWQRVNVLGWDLERALAVKEEEGQEGK